MIKRVLNTKKGKEVLFVENEFVTYDECKNNLDKKLDVYLEMGVIKLDFKVLVHIFNKFNNKEEVGTMILQKNGFENLHIHKPVYHKKATSIFLKIEKNAQTDDGYSLKRVEKFTEKMKLERYFVICDFVV